MVREHFPSRENTFHLLLLHLVSLLLALERTVGVTDHRKRAVGVVDYRKRALPITELTMEKGFRVGFRFRV